MARPVTLFTAQWADLPFETMCQKAKSGYDGLEIATWGDHLDVEQAAKDPKYVEDKKAMLKKHGLGWWAIGTHIIGQAVADYEDPRINAFVPEKYHGKPDQIRDWAVEQMKYAPAAAKNMGVDVITGFTGSPIFKYVYSFPPTSDQMIEDGFKKIVDLWSFR